MVPAGAGSRRMLCGLQGSVLPRSGGAADCCCPSLLGAIRQSYSSLTLVSSGYSSVLPLFLRYVGKGFCFKQVLLFADKDQGGTVALSVYLPKSQLQAVWCSTPTYVEKL